MLGFLRKHKNENTEKEFQAIKDNIAEKQVPVSSGEIKNSMDKEGDLKSNDQIKSPSVHPFPSINDALQPSPEDKEQKETKIENKDVNTTTQNSDKTIIEEGGSQSTSSSKVDNIFKIDENAQETEASSLEGHSHEDETMKEEIELSAKVVPPLFISVQKYKEIINELMSLKTSLLTLERVISELNLARDKEVGALKSSIEELESINKKIKYFTESFKIRGEAVDKV